MFKEYDIIVVGGGHAGCEAAASAARLGSSVLLVTMNLATIAQMSCNPAMGGIAKGQIIREIDALGGFSGIVTDHTMIQFRMLNRSKGPAMWSPRAQSDRILFALEWRKILDSVPNLHLWQDGVVDLIVKEDKISGIITSFGVEIFAKAVIITSGTFLNGNIHIGKDSFTGGRLGEANSSGLTKSLKNLGIENDRLKTGTPVRVDGNSIAFSELIEQPGDVDPKKFSYSETPKLTNQRSCYLTYTNSKTHDILKLGFNDSPLFAGRIQGSGPRYCPSIEDKIERFSSKDRHQLFIEPEGWHSNEFYINGFSSSLPLDIQFKALRTIKGFEYARILKPGYAIEYDYFPPTQLQFTLESKVIENLYFAGQVNGTTGYEEAACQGLMAGINASLKLSKQSPFILKRSEAYIGVLIDDLITKGTKEPYRMFTSRAEFRILLRQDNADTRLTPYGYDLGLISRNRYEKLLEKNFMVNKIIETVQKVKVLPQEVNAYLETKNSSPISIKTNLNQLVLRPQVDLIEIALSIPEFRDKVKELLPFDNFEECLELSQILIKYKGYMDREREMVDKINKFENTLLHQDFDYSKLKAISHEGREKLLKIKPQTIGQASRISGISPSDISVLLIHLNK